LPPQLAARLVLLLLALVSIAVALKGPARSAGSTGEREIWLPAVVWAALAAVVLIANRNLVPRSDGWFHAAVTLQISTRGLPPEDPFFAGLRLLYFWGTHAWAALWLALQPRLSVWTPLVCLNLSGAIATLLGIGLLARRLGATPWGIRMGVLLATLGYAPFAWGWIAGRAVTGQVHGFAEIERRVGAGIGPALGAMGTGLLHLSMVFFGGKFLVLTPFGLGLGIFLAFLIASIEFGIDPSRRTGIALALFIACALFVHAFVGFCCIALAGGWWAWILVNDRFGRRTIVDRAGKTAEEWKRGVSGGDGSADLRIVPRGRRPVLLLLPFAVLAGVLLVSPYLVSILAGKQGQLASGFSLRAVATWLWGGALIVPAGMLWLWRARESSGARLILGLSLLVTVAALTIDPSDNNQSKFFNLLFLMLAAPAGQAWVDSLARLSRARRALVILVLSAATLPTAFLSVWAYVCEPGARMEQDREPASLEREAYEWARKNTPPEAIFVEDSGRRDAAVLAARSVLWGGDAWAKKWGYPAEALMIRSKAVRELLADGGRSSDVDAFLDSLGRPIVIVLRTTDDRGSPAGRSVLPAPASFGPPIYQNAGMTLYLRPTRPLRKAGSSVLR
jgi:hypothetical protein